MATAREQFSGFLMKETAARRWIKGNWHAVTLEPGAAVRYWTGGSRLEFRVFDEESDLWILHRVDSIPEISREES